MGPALPCQRVQAPGETDSEVVSNICDQHFRNKERDPGGSRKTTSRSGMWVSCNYVFIELSVSTSPWWALGTPRLVKKEAALKGSLHSFSLPERVMACGHGCDARVGFGLSRASGTLTLTQTSALASDNCILPEAPGSCVTSPNPYSCHPLTSFPSDICQNVGEAAAAPSPAQLLRAWDPSYSHRECS
jgi:hypothetical protein